MAIPFTQFLRPDGFRRSVSIERGRDIEAKASKIIAAGYEFQCEELSTGQCSFTIFDPHDEEDVAIEVCANGPDVPLAIDRLVSAFAEDAAVAK